jgi:uncharacterized membrane protein
MRRAVVPLLLAGAPLVMAAGPAHAALDLCNRTSYILYAATAALASGGKSPGGGTSSAEVKGWTRIVPGDCVMARPEKLSPRLTYLVHARSSIAHSGAPRAWGGARPLCVRDGDFLLKQAASAKGCDGGGGGFPLGFAALDTRGQADWTMTFDERPPIGTLQAAQLAGVRRLLKDNGYKVGPLTGGPDKATGAALAAFRAKMKFSPGAGNAALFAALEKGARARVTPAGLTACNDGKSPLLVALGQRGHGKQSARGWWRVGPGACARLQTVPLAGERMYVLAQDTGGAVVMGGAQPFCIAGTAFEIADAAGGCAARGYGQAGFAPVDAHGAAGAVVRLGGGAGRKGDAQTAISK